VRYRLKLCSFSIADDVGASSTNVPMQVLPQLTELGFFHFVSVWFGGIVVNVPWRVKPIGQDNLLQTIAELGRSCVTSQDQ